MLLNLDVWLEILSYFVYPEDEDTLRSLALTSCGLSNLALDVVWQNGKDFGSMSIVEVINSFAPSPNEPYLEYRREPTNSTGETHDEDSTTSGSEYSGRDTSRSWVLNKPLPRAACDRTLGYLARIRQLTTKHLWQEPVWSTLSACFNPREQLLPNLRRLKIEDSGYNRNEHFIPLLSPSLKILQIREIPPLRVRTILSLAKVNGCDLEHFTYDGCTSQRLFEAIMLFQSLQSVQFPLHGKPSQRTSITITQLLTSLPSLRLLTCILGVFSPSVGEDRFSFPSLQEIKIRAEAVELHELFRRCALPSVTDMKILVRGEISSFEGLKSSCPNTRKLDLTTDSVKLRFEELAPPLPPPTQTSHPDASFRGPNLHTFAESWLDLQSFRTGSGTEFDPLPSLAIFSNLPYLDYFQVDLPLCLLLSDISKVPNLIRTYDAAQGRRSGLHTLHFKDALCRGKYPVVTAAEKQVLVEYLLLLFPSLEKFKFSGTRDVHGALFGKDCVELGKILLKLREERARKL